MPKRSNLCPVCGYDLGSPVEDYEICPSCGTQFGYDDANMAHAILRQRWTEKGCPWWSQSTQKPTNWNPLEQMSRVSDGQFPSSMP